MTEGSNKAAVRDKIRTNRLFYSNVGMPNKCQHIVQFLLNAAIIALFQSSYMQDALYYIIKSCELFCFFL